MGTLNFEHSQWHAGATFLRLGETVFENMGLSPKLPLQWVGFMDRTLLFGLARIERPPHKDVHEGRRRSDRAWQSLCAAGARQQAELGLGQTDQIIAVLGDANVTRKCEFEGSRKSGPGNRGDDRLAYTRSMRQEQRHRV